MISILTPARKYGTLSSLITFPCLIVIYLREHLGLGPGITISSRKLYIFKRFTKTRTLSCLCKQGPFSISIRSRNNVVTSLISGFYNFRTTIPCLFMFFVFAKYKNGNPSSNFHSRRYFGFSRREIRKNKYPMVLLPIISFSSHKVVLEHGPQSSLKAFESSGSYTFFLVTVKHRSVS